tara:strand:- start:1030 stop:1569 length:540 start_codon:yes stop_codon:yes gene_type:complete
MKKKCTTCGEVKSLTNFYKKSDTKDKLRAECITCWAKATKKNNTKRFQTEIGFLKMRYSGIEDRGRTNPTVGKYQCYFTFKEFCEAFRKHKEKYGMKSAWGPNHLPMTMIYLGRNGNKGYGKRVSNLSCDRLDSAKPYTIQNLIFIRSDENDRKKNTSYEDCFAQIKLHEERFINMGSI